ncbi:hypothetical protein BI364_03715 [Acidihalobacter yilgarnensis]|uniref:Uncharacterized protein n=1 Tax=Acidihalobacter yilgarnensis TaxID=2819280 RepID=A0A1D8IL64_9GAMM|nr:hypothetical protein BI364_03715 [Acidihalobacter yilgarnensis]
MFGDSAPLFTQNGVLDAILRRRITSRMRFIIGYRLSGSWQFNMNDIKRHHLGITAKFFARLRF